MLRGLLIDLDGVLYNEKGAVPGAAEAVRWLRREGYPFRFVTNTTMRSRAALVDKLGSMGVRAKPSDVFSTCVVAARWLSDQGIRRVQLLLREEPKADFAGFEVTADRPEVVVVGDMGTDVRFEILNDAFRSLREGARLIALQKGRYWHAPEGISMDAGAWVAALEYAADTQATLIGKPNRAYFETALADLGLPGKEVATVGDDLENDVVGARAAGLRTILVATGKYRPPEPIPENARPDWQIPSIAELPFLIEKM